MGSRGFVRQLLCLCLLAAAASAALVTGRGDGDVRVREVRAAPAPADGDGDTRLLIVGGTDAKPKQFPHMASMQVTMPNEYWSLQTPRHECGGALVTAEWVLTAAHCVYGVDYQALRVEVVLGIVDLAQEGEGAQRIGVQRMLVHAEYRPRDILSANDIAMLKLTRPAALTEYVKLARLPAAGAIPTGIATLSGWGSTSMDHSHMVFPDHLQFAAFPIVPLKDCIDFMNQTSSFTAEALVDTNLCNGPLDKAGVASCSADSGGPLIQEEDGEPVVVGLVSWGPANCGQKPFPSVNTRVSAFIDWINAVIAKF